MSPAIRRQFTLLDAMILVGASAIGFWLMRCHGSFEVWPPFFSLFYPSLIGVVLFNFGFLLASLTTAMLILRLRSPRPSLRRLFCQPSIQVGLAFAFAPILITLNRLPDLFTRKDDWLEFSFASAFDWWSHWMKEELHTMVGPCVTL